MKTTLGGDRLGSGNKQNISMRNFERSSHDLSTIIRTSMSAGTLVPFLSELALPGDNWDIDLQCEVLTLPTIGPLFGSYKVQLDVFQVPIRLYNAQMHMNKLNIGMDMSKVLLPQMKLNVLENTTDEGEDNEQMNPSCILKYFGISGNGIKTEGSSMATRYWNAIPMLAYWDIYKNYYANKQEGRGFAIHIDNESEQTQQDIAMVRAFEDGNAPEYENLLDNVVLMTFNPANSPKIEIHYNNSAEEPNPQAIMWSNRGFTENIMLTWETPVWDNVLKVLTYTNFVGVQTAEEYSVPNQSTTPADPIGDYALILEEFPLTNIDLMRKKILQWDDEENGAFIIAPPDEGEGLYLKPYSMPLMNWTQDEGGSGFKGYNSCKFSQEGLGIKTYQSDLFNNWIDTEWIDGANGVNAVSSVMIDTSSDSFTIDALNIQMKIYKMLNRIAVSGGTFDDWMEAQWTHQRTRGVENPMYMGGLIKELTFEEVISNSTSDEEPLGTLAGRGRLTNKHKGGHIKVRVDEPSYIMGIVSLTPRIDYSQGNKWDMDLKNMNELHVPSLDAIGFEDLISERMAWQGSTVDEYGIVTKQSVGKVPAWIHYMTNINRCYGNFAIRTKEMFMTLNRRYDVGLEGIEDITTYVDPVKFNHIFAETNLDAQNFWMQIKADITARRKMSAKVIPNL